MWKKLRQRVLPRAAVDAECLFAHSAPAECLVTVSCAIGATVKFGAFYDDRLRDQKIQGLLHISAGGNADTGLELVAVPPAAVCSFMLAGIVADLFKPGDLVFRQGYISPGQPGGQPGPPCQPLDYSLVRGALMDGFGLGAAADPDGARLEVFLQAIASCLPPERVSLNAVHNRLAIVSAHSRALHKPACYAAVFLENRAPEAPSLPNLPNVLQKALVKVLKLADASGKVSVASGERGEGDVNDSATEKTMLSPTTAC